MQFPKWKTAVLERIRNSPLSSFMAAFMTMRENKAILWDRVFMGEILMDIAHPELSLGFPLCNVFSRVSQGVLSSRRPESSPSLVQSFILGGSVNFLSVTETMKL